MNELYQLIWLHAQPLLFGLPRVSMMLLLLPALPNAVVPRLVRAAFAASLVFGLYPLLKSQSQLLSQQYSMFFLLAKEMGVGALLGVALASIFWVIQAVGTLIDNQVGHNTADVFDPFGGHSGGPWAAFTSVLTVVLFVVLGGFHVAYAMLADSYAVWPLSAEFIKLNVPLSDIGESVAKDVAANALRLAMPIIFLLCIVELGLGLVNRAAPQLNVFFVAMPVKAALATLVVAVSFSHFVSAVAAHLEHAAGWLATVSGVPTKR